MFTSDGGGFTPRRTEKHRPCAWPGPWYGSCPRMTTRVSAYGVRCSAWNTSSAGGNTSVARPLVGHELLQLLPVRLGELVAEQRVPVGGCHGHIVPGQWMPPTGGPS